MTLRRPFALALALLVAGCTGASAPPPRPVHGHGTTIRGTVTYRQRVSLPASAVVRVQVVDAAHGGDASVRLTEQAIATRGAQVPIPFAIALPSDALATPGGLVLRARIEVDGRTRFRSQAPAPLTPTAVAQPIEMIVEPVAE